MSENTTKNKSREAARPTKRAKSPKQGAARKRAGVAAAPASVRRPAAKTAKPAAKTPKTAAKKGPKDQATRPSVLGGVRDKVEGVAKTGPQGLRDLASAHRGVAIACAVALVLVVALYGPACSLYQAWRENGVLQDEQARATVESDELESDIANLMTEEGIKDEARRRGYVDDGEMRIVVEGGEEDDGSTEESTGDETPWYLHVADFIFRYDGSDGGEQ